MKRPSLLALVPLVFLFLLSVASVQSVWARATLENPQPNSSQSGIGVISGWACNANRIEIIFNETDTWQAGYGTRRTDTQGVCGDTDNGFGLLFNWNLLGDGTHTVRALADGVEFGSATVTVTTLGQEMLRGVSEAVTVSGFPTAGNDIVLRWQESQQNFVISDVDGSLPPRMSISKMYWTDAKTIQRANLDGSQKEILVSGGSPYGIALDVAGGKMYWTGWNGQSETIQRANLDGSQRETLISSGDELYGGIALDVAGGKMYWRNYVFSREGGDPRVTIERANLDGSQRELVQGGWPYDIALDVAGGKMYWTNLWLGTIQRANLDGSQRETLVSGDELYGGIALDVAGGKMYWPGWNGQSETIQRANLDGSQRETLVSGDELADDLADNSADIALDVAGGKIYWTNLSLGTIQRANLDGSQRETLVSGGSPGSIALSTDGPASVPSGGTSGSPPRVLENPKPGSFQSGIGVISGWVCDAGRIEIEFNNDTTNRWQAGYGTRRTDTQGICGDTNNGFGLLFNWNLLGNGTHTVRVLADGVEFANATVTVTTLGQEVLRGASKAVTLPDFPSVGTDSVLQWQEAQQNFVITIAAPTQRLVGVYPDITIPTGVTSVRAGDVSVTSLSSPTGEVRASPDSTLLLAEDAGGTVLLSIANMDGGLLGEMGQGEVEVSLASTAVTLVALAAGYPITAIDQSVADQITAHANYPALLAAMKTALAADKNFLDRIFDYPEVIRLIRQVATFRAGVRQARQAVQQMHQMLSAQSAAVPPTGIYKDDFWCSWFGWPCSPWHEHEPWQWFGDAKGVAHFYPDSYLDVIGGLLTGGVSLSVGAYTGILKEATAQPFLARSHGSPGLHATANPAFVDYAMELYSGDKYIGWYYTPRNSTVVRKLRNSGAAQRLIPTGAGTLLTQRIDRVRFERYRLSFDSEQATTLTFLNGFKAVMAAVNLFSDFSAVVKWLDGLPGDGEIVLDLAECVVDSSISRHIPKATSGDTVAPMLAFIRASANAWIDQLVRCPIGDLPVLITEQVIRSWIDTAGLLTPYGWAKLAFDATNEAVPVFTSYLSPGAGSAEYFIDWQTDAAGNPYIARVSETPPDDKEPPPTQPSMSKMYWTDNRGRIQRANLDGSQIETLVSGLGYPNGIALDMAGGKMYWTDNRGRIQRANLDGSQIETLVSGLGYLESIALDVAGDRMYWHSKFRNRIQWANLDGSQIETLVGGLLFEPNSIALDVAGNKMYWTNSQATGDRIQRANLDGSQIETLVWGELLHSKSCIALDVTRSKMYWADGISGIQRANLDGSQIETLGLWVSSIPEGSCIALDVTGSKIYWTGNRGRIQRANLDGSQVETLVSGLGSPNGIALSYSVPGS